MRPTTLTTAGVLLILTGPLQAQEQGRPTFMPPGAEAAEALFANPDSLAALTLAVAASACPEDSEWHRNILERLLDPSRMEMVVEWQAQFFLASRVGRCDWPPLHDWFRRALGVARHPYNASALLDGIEASWEDSDEEVIFQYLTSGVPDAKIRTRAYSTAWRGMGQRSQRHVGFFFRVYRAGVMTEASLRGSLNTLPIGETAESFVREGVAAVLEDPDHPYSIGLLRAVGRGIYHGVEDGTVPPAVARRVIDQMAPLEGREGFSRAMQYRQWTVEKLGGG